MDKERQEMQSKYEKKFSECSQLQEKNQTKQDKDSVKNGEIIKQYLLSLEKMLEESERLQSFQFTNV